jgi:hypothetical protein
MRLGSDPEVFLLSAEGKPLSAIGMIGADKWNPLQMWDMPAGFTLQEDNVALEYGIPPAASAEEFVKHITDVMERSKDYLQKGITFSKLSCIVFPEDQMEHPMAYIFGCEPDYCAWTKEENKKPKPPHKHMRSAGGHVHVETTLDPNAVVKNMDLYLSIPAVLMDKGEERKQLYGKAGACRYKPYGVEYRTLSNFWIFEQKLIEWVWRNTERALTKPQDFNYNMATFPGPDSDNCTLGQLVQDCINQNDKKMAEALVSDFGLEVI